MAVLVWTSWTEEKTCNMMQKNRFILNKTWHKHWNVGMKKLYNILSFFYTEMVEMCLMALLHPNTSHLFHTVSLRDMLVRVHGKLRLPVTVTLFSSHTVSIHRRWMHHAVRVLTLFPPSYFMFTSGTPSPDLWLYQEFLIDHNVRSSRVLISRTDGFFFFEGPCPGLLKRRLTVCILRWEERLDVIINMLMQ